MRCSLIALSARTKLQIFETMQEHGWQITADFKLLVPIGTDIRPKVIDSSSTALPDRIQIDSVNYRVLYCQDISGRKKTLAAYIKQES